MADTTTGAQVDPRSFVAHCLVRLGYSHDKAEQLMQAALDQHASQLADRQREAIKKTDDPVFYDGEAGWLADLIDPRAAGPTS